MRLNRLELRRYGKFTDRVIELPHDVNFHIVAGLNEAGKTTALAALHDLLFGFEVRTPYNFLHKNQDLQLAADITGADGTALSFVRRKGSKNTLLDLAGAPLGEDALLPFLHAMDRQRFTDLFGLSQTSLRQGGDALLQADGELAQSLFGSASGLQNLRHLLTDFAGKASALFTERGSKPPLNAALAARQTAKKRLRDCQMLPKAWQDLQKRQNELAARRATLLADELAQRRLEGQARRNKRIRAPLQRLAMLEDQARAFADLPDIGIHDIEQFQAAWQSRGERGLEIGQVEAEITRLTGRLAAAPVDPAMLEQRVALEQLSREIGQFAERRRAIEEGERTIAALDAQIASVERDLSLNPDQAGQISNLAVQKLRRHAHAGRALRQSQRTNLQENHATDQALQRLACARQALPEIPPLTGLQAAIDGGQRVIDLADRQPSLAAKLAQDDAAMAERCARMDLWRADPATWRTTALPAHSTIDHHRGQLDQVQSKLERLQAQAVEQAADLVKAQITIEQLQGDHPALAPDALSNARAKRDQGWALIQDFYLNNQGDGAALDEHFAGDDHGAAFSAAISESDALADQRTDHAGQWAALRQAQNQAAALRASIAHLQAEIAKAGQAHASCQQEWAAIWQDFGFAPRSPAEMRAWLDLAIALQQDLVALEAQRSELEHDAAAVQTAKAKLLRASGHADQTASLRALLTASQALMADYTAQRQRHQELVNEGERLAAAKTRLDDMLAQQANEWSDWLTQWQQDLATLGLPPETGLDDIDDFLSGLDGWLGMRAQIQSHTGQVAALKAQHTAMVDGFNQLAAALQIDAGAEENFEVRAQKLTDLWQTTLTNQALHDGLCQEIAEKSDILAAKKSDLAGAQAQIEQAKGAFGKISDDALNAAFERIVERRRLRTAIETLRNEIIERGDGENFEQLAASCGERDADDDDAVIAAAADALEQIRSDISACDAELGEIKAQIERQTGSNDAGDALQDLQKINAEIRDLTGRYVAEKTAALMLKRALDRVRQERQGPILTEAGQFFAALTDRAFGGLEVIFDEQDEAALAGVRANGEQLRPSAMSEGTRDQLFLALRMAMIGEYCARAEPLPLIGDDLLVAFDDRRAAAALNALAALSATTQVVLFTHHQHLASLAADVLGPKQAAILSLDEEMPA